MENEKDPLEEIELDSIDELEITPDENEVEEIQSDSTEPEESAVEEAVVEETPADSEESSEEGEADKQDENATTYPPDSSDTESDASEEAESSSQEGDGDEGGDGNGDSDEEFFEKHKVPILAGGGGLLLLIIGLVLFLSLRNCDKKESEVVEEEVAVEEVAEEIQAAISEFSYEIYPFPNRSAGIRKLIPKLKKIEKELMEQIKKLPEDKKIIIYGHTSRENKKQKPGIKNI